ncbi:MAG: hypothetical protein H7067_00285 [Burkholderiales bacterium]|nr:hypothetical protein [Opitutaceae bacterium]
MKNPSRPSPVRLVRLLRLAFAPALALAFAATPVFALEPNFMQTSDGLVVIEAEHFQANTPQGPYTWAARANPTASAASEVISAPADKVLFAKPEQFTTSAPRLDYKVTFLQPGRHFLWVRAQGAFVHLGLDEKPVLNGQRLGGFDSKALSWRNQCRAVYGQPGYFDIPTAGEHTIHLWMFQGGTAVDKIILTPWADFKPDDSAANALPESPRGKLPPQPPAVTAGPAQEINPPTTTVSLAGSAKDYDGQVAAYRWTQVDGPTPATFTPPDAATTVAANLTALGTYRFRLNAKDDTGLTAARDVTIKVTPAVPPLVTVPTEVILITDTALDLTATATDADSDPKVNPLTFQWTQLGGPASAKNKGLNKATLALSGLLDGTYLFRVGVTDHTGNTTTADTTLVKRPVPATAAIAATDPSIQYFGRFNLVPPKTADAPPVMESGWTNTSIRARFEGTSLRARLSLAGWGGAANFYAILDGDEKAPIVLLGDNRTDWLVAEGLADTAHTIELVRLGGGWNASSSFGGFYLDAGKKLLPPPPRPARRIEFYGDSISEGGLMPDQPFANGYLAYAATTGRILKADTSVVAKSGMGLVKGFTLPQTLPGMFDRTAPMRGDVKWDFTKWTPHVVVVNIGQNDSWTAADPAVFTETYVKFIQTLRGHYPKALIVCALGSMDATAPKGLYPGYLTTAVERLKTEFHDPRVETFFFEFLGAKGHPSSVQARAMAEKLAAHLEAKGPALWQD